MSNDAALRRQDKTEQKPKALPGDEEKKEAGGEAALPQSISCYHNYMLLKHYNI